ncbi:MAG TPA: 2-oxoacid:acceptor oxidoreductase family protein [Solirubrobacteraceae bacterium]|nr:2-oxoacid:acceptor oxidoreductase family protein [Solirubrobacteraceae bacterium]
MFEVRIHGRGGQGVVTAAELLSLAAFLEGLRAQAFPSFGSERMGAPVIAFCRIDTAAIRLREPIAEPDAVVVQDPTLLHHVDVFGGLRPEGFVLVNSTRTLEQLGLGELRTRMGTDQRRGGERLLTVPASEIARARLGRPIPNAALLGGLVALTGLVKLDSLMNAIGERFSGAAAEGNRNAARDTYQRAATLLHAGPDQDRAQSASDATPLAGRPAAEPALKDEKASAHA